MHHFAAMSEVQTPVGLISIPDAQRLPFAMDVLSLDSLKDVHPLAWQPSGQVKGNARFNSGN